MTAIIGDAVVRVGGDIIGLKQGMAEGSRTVSDFASKSGKHLRKTANQLGKVGTAAVAAGAAMVAGLYVKGATVIDQQAKMARSIGGTVVSVQSLERAAELAGIAQGVLTKSSAKLNSRLGEAMRGTGEAAQQLEILGLNAENLSNMDADERLAAIADRMREMGYSSAQAADTLRDFGIREEKLVGLMIEGGDAFRSARQEVNDFGMAISDVDAAQVEAANDAMTAIGATMQTVANTVAVELSPYVQEVGARLGQASKESGGFREEVENAIEGALRHFGKLGDFLQGLRVTFKGLELVGTGFGAAIISAVQVSLEAFAKFDEAVTWTANKAIDALNTIPGVDIAKIDPFTNSPFMEGMREMADAARSRVGAVRSELANMAMQEMPSDKIEKFLADVAARSQETAAAVVGARQNMVTMPEDEMGGGENADADKIDKELEAIRNKFKTEQQLLEEKYLAEQELLDLALEAKRVSEAEHYDLSESLLWEHTGELTDIEKQAAEKRKQIAEWEAQAKRQAIGKALSDMTTLMNSESRKMFEIGKAAAMGQTIMDTYAGAQAAFTSLAGIPIIGPALGAAAAAAAVLSGVARVRSIRSQSFGGGGGAAATGSNTTAVNAASTPVGGGGGGGGNKTFTLEGFDPNKSYSGGNVRGLLDEIQGAIDNGYKLNLTPGGA